MYRGWTQTDYQNKHHNINQKDEGTQDDRGRDGGTKLILRIKEEETRLTLQEHDDDDDEQGASEEVQINENHQAPILATGLVTFYGGTALTVVDDLPCSPDLAPNDSHVF